MNKILKIIISVIIILIALIYILYRNLFFVYINSWVSMEPTILNQNKVLVNKYVYNFDDPKLWDIIVFDSKISLWKKYYIKRIIGLPGEKIKFENWFVFIKKTFSDDFVKLKEDYLLDTVQWKTNLPIDVIEKEFSIPENNYFVLGDNRLTSSDSRSCFMSCSIPNSSHFISREDIVWKVENIVQ